MFRFPGKMSTEGDISKVIEKPKNKSIVRKIFQAEFSQEILQGAGGNLVGRGMHFTWNETSTKQFFREGEEMFHER